MSQEPEDPANMLLQVVGAIAGLFAILIVGGIAVGLVNYAGGGADNNPQVSPAPQPSIPSAQQ